jgi:uncharacterized membrane protein YhiD involved in acid resistance
MTDEFASAEWARFYGTHGVAGLIAVAVFILVVYFLIPSMKSWIRLRQDRAKSLEEWIRTRAETLERERDKDIERLRQDNQKMKSSIEMLEQRVSNLLDLNQKLDHKIKSFEWVFLLDICNSLSDNIAKEKQFIADRIKSVKDEEVVNAIENEFNKIVADVKSIFVMKQYDKMSTEDKDSLVFDSDD